MNQRILTKHTHSKTIQLADHTPVILLPSAHNNRNVSDYFLGLGI